MTATSLPHRMIDRGREMASEGPGLAIVVDRERLATADFYSCVLSQGHSSITASAALSRCPYLEARRDIK